MKSVLKLIAAASTAVAVVAFVAPAARAAQAEEFCAYNSVVKGCGFTTLEQCNASVAGAGGTCGRNPNYKGPDNSLAYKPKPARSRAKQSEN